MQVMRLRHSWPPAPTRIPAPDAAEGEIPAMRGSLLDWEEAVRWIARGWDCIEEYTHDVFARLCLQEALDDCKSRGIVLPESYLARLTHVDGAFKHVTYDSALCCLMQDEWYRDQSIYFFRRQQAEFPKPKYWFLYRWQRGTAWRAPAPNVPIMNER